MEHKAREDVLSGSVYTDAMATECRGCRLRSAPPQSVWATILVPAWDHGLAPALTPAACRRAPSATVRRFRTSTSPAVLVRNGRESVCQPKACFLPRLLIVPKLLEISAQAASTAVPIAFNASGPKEAPSISCGLWLQRCYRKPTKLRPSHVVRS